jgi:hypothetical protein
MKFSKRWKYELSLFQKFANGEIKKGAVKADQRLLHSGSVSVLGDIADTELSSKTVRKKWLDDPSLIAEIIQKDIFEKVPANFWDNKDVLIDNTGKGRDSLRKVIDEQM